MNGALFSLFVAATPASFDGEIAAAIADVQHIHAVDTALVKAIIHVESAFNPTAVSNMGAIGLMQVMPFNASKLGLKETDLWDPRLNVLAGVRLLAVLLEYYEDDLVSVLVAYNAGPRPRFAPVPQNGETPAYVSKVLLHLNQYKQGSTIASNGR